MLCTSLCLRPRIWYDSSVWNFINTAPGAFFRSPVALSDPPGSNLYRAIWGTNNRDSLGPNGMLPPSQRCFGSSSNCNMLGFQAQAGPLSGSPIFNVDPTYPTSNFGDIQNCPISTWQAIWSGEHTA